jgi:hypothetical protein
MNESKEKKYAIIKQNDNVAPYITEYIVDDEADVKELPTNVYPGSTCIVASSSNVYILNTKKEWVRL